MSYLRNLIFSLIKQHRLSTARLDFAELPGSFVVTIIISLDLRGRNVEPEIPFRHGRNHGILQVPRYKSFCKR